MQDHHRFMRIALSLARRNLGQTWPNPSVGAVVVKEGRMIAQGITQPGGRPHAETIALAEAGDMAQDATLYVSLEPCAHQGKTPPCTSAIIDAGISRCVVACRDSNPKVNGQGIAQLRQAGIEVIENICSDEARSINRGFFSVVEKKRPYIALKIATSLDGRITLPPLPSGEGRGEGNATGEISLVARPSSGAARHLLPAGEGIRWLTGEAARAYGHLLRSRYDAIATGIGTVLADDPLLTCRLPGLRHRSPVRVLFDRQGRLPKTSQLFKTAHEVPLWVMDTPLPEAVRQLTDKGITRLLVEAGQGLSSAFLMSGLVDRVYWFRAPVMAGEQGLPAFSLHTALAPWRQIHHIAIHPDSLDIFECSPEL